MDAGVPYQDKDARERANLFSAYILTAAVWLVFAAAIRLFPHYS